MEKQQVEMEKFMCVKILEWELGLYSQDFFCHPMDNIIRDNVTMMVVIDSILLTTIRIPHKSFLCIKSND